jgi:hypothetical protein
MALGPLSVVDAQPFITNPGDYGRLAQVNTFFRDLVHELALRHGIDLSSPEFHKPHEKLKDQEFGWFKSLGDHILATHPHEKFIYVIPGGSLVGVGVYMQQVCPGARVVNMPISGLTEEQMSTNPRTFDETELGTYYQSYLGPHLGALRGGARLLVMDYSSGGNTLKVIQSQLSGYLKRIGFQTPPLKIFAFGSQTLGPSEKQDEMKNFVAALQESRFKTQHQHLLYDKPEGEASDFTGRVEEKHAVFVERYMVLWDEIAARLSAERAAV